MKKLVAVLSSILFLGSMSAFAIDTNNFAVVNVQQVLQQSPKIKSLNEKLQGQFKSRQEKLVAEQKSLQDEADKFKKQADTMAAKDKDAAQKKLNDEQADLVKQVTAFQKDLNTEQNKAMQGVLSQLNEIISGIAKKNNYSLVLDSQAVIYAPGNIDITKDVAKEFDKK